ncbi:substrate-binding domain-containing protein [uncultured Nostoc sp.]|uniref:substrate-binding domain-containing protein n=1 Tax=uncultured Nostoc sp. TaxID=340711 RepID=UPI0035CA5BD6
MKKYLFAISLITGMLGVTLPSQVWAVSLYNAGGLKAAFGKISKNFTVKYGIPITQVSGPCGLLRERIEQELSSKKASADVYASASTRNPQKLFNQGLSGRVIKFSQTRMVALVRPGLKVTTDKLLDLLLDPNIKLATSTPIKDSSGDYAQEIFQQADSIKPGSFKILNGKALRLVGGAPTSITPPNNVDTFKYILKDDKLADVAIVYYTTALASVAAASDLQIVELPDKLAKNVTLSLTVVKGANPEAEKLAQYILSREGEQVLLKYGFSSLQKSTSLPEPQKATHKVVQQSKFDIVRQH